jgi:hypothetical protein
MSFHLETTRMLCEVCKRIDLVKANDLLLREQCIHHKRFADIRRSAANGCELCQMIEYCEIKAREHHDRDEEETGDTPIRYYMYGNKNRDNERSGPYSSIVFSRFEWIPPYRQTLYTSLRAFTHNGMSPDRIKVNCNRLRNYNRCASND